MLNDQYQEEKLKRKSTDERAEAMNGAVNHGGKRLLDIRETATYLGLQPRSIYNRIGPRSKNPFPVRPKRVGRKVLFDVRELEEFVANL
jgi:predicted DNA-binding transcriptional regulator AlpA